MARHLKHVLAAAILGIAQAAVPSYAQNLKALATYQGPDRQQKLIEGAKKEGSLLWYTTTPTEYATRLIEPFEKKYGIKVNVWRARSEVILQKVMSESKGGNNSADVIASIAPPMEALYREKLLQEVDSPQHKDLIPSAVAPHRGWASTLQYVFVQAYNTDKVKKEDLPKTYQDLLDPKWKGKLAIESSDHEWVSSIIKDMGEANGAKFFRDLVAGNGLSVRTGHPLLTNLVASGEVPLGLTVYNYSPEQQKKKGAPIDWFVIEPAIAIPDAIGVYAKAARPHAALLFYDYMLSEEAQRILSQIGYVPTNSKVESPMKGFKIKSLNPSTLLDEQDKSFAQFESLILKKASK